MSPFRASRCRLRPSLVALVAAAAVSQGCILAVPPEVYAGREKAMWLHGYGYASVGFAGHVAMFGDDMSGVEPSQGVTLNFPVAPGPVLVLGAAALIVAAAKDGDLDLDLDLHIDFSRSASGPDWGETDVKTADKGSAKRSGDASVERSEDDERGPPPLAVPAPEDALEGEPIDGGSQAFSVLYSLYW
jgi:hypothetical protein